MRTFARQLPKYTKLLQFFQGNKLTRAFSHVLPNGFSTHANFVTSQKLLQAKQRDTVLSVDPKRLRQLSHEEKQRNIVIQELFPYINKNINVFVCGQKEKVNGTQTPTNSFIQYYFPFSTDSVLRERLQRFDTSSIRYGKLLEVFDWAAGSVIYNYIDNRYNEYTNVTACVDHIHLFKNLNMYKDLTINAYPTHSGNTSLEIQIDCWQEGEYMLTALFLFVAREKTNPALSKAIPNLSFEGEQDVQGCELRRAIGEHNKIERKYQRDNTLLLNPPSDSEILEIHQFYLQRQQLNRDKQNWIAIDDTLKIKSLLMHRQEKNIHGNIFGGFLMRESYELGWLAAALHLKKQPEILHIDDFQFYVPVKVGQTVDFAARVGYIQDNLIQVYVTCESVSIDNTRKRTNDMRLTFQLQDDDTTTTNASTQSSNASQLLKVYPATYSEALIYADSKRRLTKFLYP